MPCCSHTCPVCRMETEYYEHEATQSPATGASRSTTQRRTTRPAWSPWDRRIGSTRSSWAERLLRPLARRTYRDLSGIRGQRAELQCFETLDPASVNLHEAVQQRSTPPRMETSSSTSEGEGRDAVPTSRPSLQTSPAVPETWHSYEITQSRSSATGGSRVWFVRRRRLRGRNHRSSAGSTVIPAWARPALSSTTASNTTQETGGSLATTSGGSTATRVNGLSSSTTIASPTAPSSPSSDSSIAIPTGSRSREQQSGGSPRRSSSPHPRRLPYRQSPTGPRRNTLGNSFDAYMSRYESPTPPVAVTVSTSPPVRENDPGFWRTDYPESEVDTSEERHFQSDLERSLQYTQTAADQAYWEDWRRRFLLDEASEASSEESSLSEIA